MSTYTEEREFVLRVVMRRTFAENYDGEEDGYEWAKGMDPLLAEVVKRCLAVLASQPDWTVHTANRGRSSQDEVTVIIER